MTFGKGPRKGNYIRAAAVWGDFGSKAVLLHIIILYRFFFFSINLLTGHLYKQVSTVVSRSSHADILLYIIILLPRQKVDLSDDVVARRAERNIGSTDFYYYYIFFSEREERTIKYNNNNYYYVLSV